MRNELLPSSWLTFFDKHPDRRPAGISIDEKAVTELINSFHTSTESLSIEVFNDVVSDDISKDRHPAKIKSLSAIMCKNASSKSNMSPYFKQVLKKTPNDANIMLLPNDFCNDSLYTLLTSKPDIYTAACFTFWLFYGLLYSKKRGKPDAIAREMINSTNEIITCAAMFGFDLSDLSDILFAVLTKCDFTNRLNDYKFMSKNKDLKEVLSEILESKNADASQLDVNIEQREEYVATFINYLSNITGYGVIILNTIEPQEAESVLEEASIEAFSGNVNIIHWDVLQKQKIDDTDSLFTTYNESFNGYLNFINKELDKWEDNRVFIFRISDMELKNTNICEKLQLLSERLETKNNEENTGKVFLFLITRHADAINNIFIDETVGYPNDSTIKQICKKYLQDSMVTELVISNCRGLTRNDIKRVINSVSSSGSSNEIAQRIIEEKNKIIKNQSALEIVELNDKVEDYKPCGLKALLYELDNVKEIFAKESSAKMNHVSMPKGLLLTGIPGCGKSLSAKYAAKLFERPLLRLDMGSVMSKYQGESDHNFKDALKLADAIAPCVLWIDEIEKAFDNSNEKSESSSRILGSFLTWLQEKETSTFVIGTSNDINKLPAEFIRSGRWSKLFFVDLPEKDTINEMLNKYCAKKGLQFQEYDKIVGFFKDYSGAEIEQVVENVVCEKILHNKPVSVDLFKNEAKKITPLSTSNKDEITNIRTECKKKQFQDAEKGGAL